VPGNGLAGSSREEPVDGLLRAGAGLADVPAVVGVLLDLEAHAACPGEEFVAAELGVVGLAVGALVELAPVEPLVEGLGHVAADAPLDGDAGIDEPVGAAERLECAAQDDRRRVHRHLGRGPEQATERVEVVLSCEHQQRNLAERPVDGGAVTGVDELRLCGELGHGRRVSRRLPRNRRLHRVAVRKDLGDQLLVEGEGREEPFRVLS
jgi:hypothetical protein